MKDFRIAKRCLGIEISGIRKLFEAARPGSINMGLGQPDFDTPDHIKEGAIRAIRDGMTGYTSNMGIPELREALSRKFRDENKLEYQPDQIIVTAGASEALHIIMHALIEDGDRVLFADPGFVSYGSLALLAGGRPEGVPLDAELRIDLEEAKTRLDGARIFVLNSPGNPTGAVETEESIRALVEYANDAGVTVVSDEVYEHFIYEGTHWSAARFGENVITVNAASKTYAMTGWRLGYLAGPKEITEQCLKVHQYAQACATSISQYAALTAYTGPQDCVGLMRDEYRWRRDFLYGALREMGIVFPCPQGAFYLFAPLGKHLINRILGKGVVIVPGEAFGCNAPEYARLSYAASRSDLQTAVERIRAARSE
ncbi:MAG TPA: pyridoxal phosphate-dependent aminotransferase [Methanoregulaceae archaeon]|nr:MAG: pyridoxal phosphate-dependent aminotransferase [Methanolinea sp.]HON82071.1 pyridoxal phosphate-dependent aminotransferase [Methanoregulaceae archaeon]HPD10769.1 pyridoxal phosphate-dependent aminotransferase [Methanoregulaceae archaeon]HRT15957.1 pyridoxal phosphate-dependent aminotransferase [Methanoregulaceae archaeon]HRU31422.1 pyridoxal phosphate-dependent aminotransferase [Methanoregulaceae archaeon]